MIAPEVGGGFGAKFMIYPEEIVVPAVARKLGRAVKWVEDRREHFLSAIQERDQYWSVEFAADARGQILGVRGEMVHDHGAYTPQGTNVPYNSASSLSGPYLVPACRLQVSVVHTNKVPVATVRGAGYPQAAFVMERVLDRIAQGVGIDRAECRRRNLIPADQIPYVKPLKSRAGVPLTIDSGDFPALQARALAEIGYAEFDARRRKAARAACAVASAWPMASSRRGAGRSSPRGSVSRRPDRFRSIPARWPWGRASRRPWRSCARRISAWRRRPSRCGPGTPRSSAMAWADSPAARP